MRPKQFQTQSDTKHLDPSCNFSFAQSGIIMVVEERRPRPMMYKFLTLVDGTEIVHSDMMDDGKVKVYVEKPDANDCFHYLTCYLPSYEVVESFGFSEEEMTGILEVIRSTANLILEFAKGRGFENAAGF